MPTLGDIPGLAGYQASDDGEIFDARKGRVKPQRPTSNGALKVDIGKSTFMVHDLVARTFHGRPASRGYRVRHLNNDLADNRADNLVWFRTTGPTTEDQEPTYSLAVEREYDRLQRERLELVDLMQN